MVHVWSINSGERFQGHHGPLVELLPFVFFILRFFPVHISNTKQAMVMKSCGWIDLIKGECSTHEP